MWLRFLFILFSSASIVSCGGGGGNSSGNNNPTPSPNPSVSSTPSASPTPSASITPLVSSTPFVSPTPLPSQTATPFNYPTACQFPQDASQTGIDIVPAFPNLGFQQPTDMAWSPDTSDRLFVAQKNGIVRVFENNPETSSASVFLDISAQVNTEIDAGLLSLTFHPDYANNGYFYLRYIAGSNDTLRSVVSRFTVSDNPNVANPGSEEIIIEVPLPNPYHLGGDIDFGPDGYLYISHGDAGPQNDGNQNGQNRTNLHSTVVRIDVDSSGEAPYRIPSDNPFANTDDGSLPEIYAWGFRNPWRMSFDRVSGNLWLGDCGQDTAEEINLVTLGGNYGWSQMEGSSCFPSDTECDSSNLISPVVEHLHSEGVSCVIGGYVYRGDDIPALYGAYVYADLSNMLFTFRYGEEAAPSEPTMVTPATFIGFGEDKAGELYMIQHQPGAIWRLVQTTPVAPPENFPQTLSETGCFSDVPSLNTIDGILPYELNTPLWSDHSTKSRFIALPQAGKITWSETEKWGFPSDTVLIKHFAMETLVGDPASAIPLETRFLIVEEEGAVRGYSYRWNDEGTEANLLAGASSRDLAVTLPGDTEPSTVTWQFPSRFQCNTCHNTATGGVLGLETAQLNRVGALGSGVNQLDALSELELFTVAPALTSEASPRFHSLDDTTASLENRARAYMHSNCANCHLPGGPAGTSIDLRFSVPFAETGTCNAVPSKGDLGVSGATLITPGAASESVVHLRMSTQGPYRMPPIATSLVDELAVQVMTGWIDELNGCQE